MARSSADVHASAQTNQLPPELPLVEAGPTVGHEGLEGASHTRESHPVARLERSVWTQLLCPGQLAHQVAGQRQQQRGGEPLHGELDGGGEDPVQREAAEAGVQGEPAVDGARDGDAAEVSPCRQHGVAFGPELLRTDAGSGTSTASRACG